MRGIPVVTIDRSVQGVDGILSQVGATTSRAVNPKAS